MSSDKPKEFDEVIKPAPSPLANPISPPSEQIAGRTKEWDKFLGEVNDNYIKTLRDYAPKNEYTIEINGESKTYERRKIKARQYAELEKVRAQFNKASNSRDMLSSSESERNHIKQLVV